ncbi:MAG: hypothetical protein QOF48_309 [Verrucomicrobiota bacterium]|jgi:hypothetical protein
MFIWMIALFLLLALGAAGYYQGALRAGFTLVGLIVAALLAVPLSGVFKAILGIFNLEHPVVLSFIAPVAAFIVLLICFKAGGLATHRQVDTYFKYKASDTLRLLYDRMNARVGAVVGVLNAFVYFILLSIVIYVLGYFAMQVRTGDKDPFVIRVASRLADDLKETKMDKAVAAFLPKSPLYYDGVDVVATIFLNPLIQSRLSTYPVFLLLSEKSEYKQLGNSAAFMDFWTKAPSLEEFRSHELVKPLVESTETYKTLMGMLNNDLKDLKTYLETGKSPKYDEELILGRWEFDGAQSFALAKKRITNPTAQQLKRLRVVYGTVFKDATLIATVDNQVIFKLPKVPNAKGTRTGTWEQAKGGGYTLAMVDGGPTYKVEALVEGRKLTFSQDNFALVFER